MSSVDKSITIEFSSFIQGGGGVDASTPLITLYPHPTPLEYSAARNSQFYSKLIMLLLFWVVFI